ncbi:MAG TPA: MFS transporter [Anaerolineales bacterium]|nr:MFS transporter [Anaerolineales bacterium]
MAVVNAKSEKKWALPFFAIWTGQAVSLLGSQLVQFALIWWLTKATGSATVLATASLVGLLPQVFVMPVAGTLVDRWNRRATMILADGFIALATVALAALFWSGKVQIWQVYLLMFIRSAAGGFHWSAMQASTSLLVPEKHLSRIQGLNQMTNGGLNIISAPLGALLLELLPIHGVLAIDIGTAMLAITPLFFISIPQPERSSADGAVADTSVWQDFKAGLKYAAGWPGLVLIGVMATVINLLLTPAFSLLPILVTKHFNGQAFHLAWLESGWGIGVVFGGLVLGAWGGFRRRILTSMLGLLLIGVSATSIGLAPASAFTFAVGASFLMGFANPLTNGPIFAVMQSVVEPGMQGRVFTLLGSLATAMTPVGLLIAGPIADRFGVQSWFILGGIVTAGMGVVGYFIPALVNIENNHRHGHLPDEDQTLLEKSQLPAVGPSIPQQPAESD